MRFVCLGPIRDGKPFLGDSDVGDLKLVTICGCWGLNFDVDDIY